MGTLRAGAILTVFLLVTVPLMAVQWGLVATGSRAAAWLPHRYHRFVCRLLGIRIRVEGTIDAARQALIVANHVSWLDIPVLSAIAPVSFIAKQEVARWPFIGWLARLQRSLFIDRNSRYGARSQAAAIADRLAAGDRMILFAEGTTGDGNRILPFKSALLAALGLGNGEVPSGEVTVQTLAICYTHLHGIPLGRTMRPGVAWYGDMDVPGHAWRVLKAGPIDVAVRIGEPLKADSFASRKALAAHVEEDIRRAFSSMLKGARPMTLGPRAPGPVPAPMDARGPAE